MSRKQKLSILIACILYVAVIFGFYYFSLTLIILLFLMHSVALAYFAYLCYQMHNDYTGAEHLQQEVGVQRAEKEQLRLDYENLLKVKDQEIHRRLDEIEQLNMKLESEQKNLEDAQSKLNSSAGDAAANSGALETLLPPEEDEAASEVDIIDVAKRAIDELAESAEKVGLIIHISSASESLMVKASANRLLIMFRNIIDNSIKYMKKAGTLVITISAIEDDIFIVLKDTGEGLPENETKHIFELNYQGSNRISGNGLGLTQAKAIVEHYGGTIYARSPGGNGMGIYIQLPTT